MTNIRLKLFSLATIIAFSALNGFAYNVAKSEFRSAWVATVWALDWPTTGASAETQMAELDRMLDSLANNNFNAVNFQVRSMCDAMYKSSYEPWSSYLTGTRGKDPGFDPLGYVVDGCHKRGMECHAWVNPYRFSTGANWDTELDQELKNSGHLLSHNNGQTTTTILDPAQQWTIDRIVNVCREIITNYDVDGILYDDYFYPSGIPTNSSAGDYSEWKNSGTKLSFGDWRRDNVNRMVKAVYDMIQTVKPWVRYGISPAGVACSSSSVGRNTVSTHVLAAIGNTAAFSPTLSHGIKPRPSTTCRHRFTGPEATAQPTMLKSPHGGARWRISLAATCISLTALSRSPAQAKARRLLPQRQAVPTAPLTTNMWLRWK